MFDVTGLAQSLSECSQQVCDLTGRFTAEEANHRHRWLLRARRERPRDRAADECDELAPFHWSLRPVLATGTVAHTSMRQETAALRDFYPAYDRYGSSASHRHAPAARGTSASLQKRTSECLPRHVRLVPKADKRTATKNTAIRSPRPCARATKWADRGRAPWRS